MAMTVWNPDLDLVGVDLDPGGWGMWIPACHGERRSGAGEGAPKAEHGVEVQGRTLADLDEAEVRFLSLQARQSNAVSC